jgi:alanine-glyoxylate transaminase/serine-glyoxylate transaminase/serine-pyruvate transaminase
MTKRKLMIPGPVDIDESVRSAMSVPSMPHYGQDWIRLYGETQEMARQVFGTLQELYLIAGPGTLALEIALASSHETGDPVWVPTNGFFGDRLITVAESHGLKPIVTDVELGQPITAEITARALDQHPEVKSVVVVHHETSTGVLNPLEEIAGVARERDKLVIVDAVSSLGGVRLPVDDWGIDLCASVANKALGTPPALALLSISERAWEAVEARTSPCGWYTDLKTWRWYAKNWGDWHPTPVTMPTSNLYALHRSLELLLNDGLEIRFASYRAAAAAVRAGLRVLGFEMFVDDTCASPLTTAFRVPTEVGADDLKAWLEEEAGVMVSGGIGDLKGDILRVGHIGLARKRDYVVSFLLGVEGYLRSRGDDIRVGTSLVALDDLEI